MQSITFKVDAQAIMPLFDMNAPIPANDSRPLIPGDRVRILPEFQDAGDDAFERIVIEAPPDSPRVLVKTMIPGFDLPPTERIDARMLERLEMKYCVQLSIQSDLELNALQVAIDDLIMHLEDVLEGEEPEDRYIIEERLDAARRLKQGLDGMDWPRNDGPRES